MKKKLMHMKSIRNSSINKDPYKPIISELLRILKSSDVKHYLLLGSCSRNEHRFIISNDSIIGLSDIELIVFSSNNDKISSEIGLLSDRYKKKLGSIFSIDVDFLPVWRYPFLKNRFIFFEGLKNSRNVPKLIKKIILSKKFDKIELSQTIIWRFFKILKKLQKELDTNNNSKIFKYFIARNILDLHAVYLYLNDKKLHSITLRKEYLFDNDNCIFPSDLLKSCYEVFGNSNQLLINDDYSLGIKDFRLCLNIIIDYMINNNIKILPNYYQLLKRFIFSNSNLSILHKRFLISDRMFLIKFKSLIKSDTTSSYDLKVFFNKFSDLLPYLNNFS